MFNEVMLSDNKDMCVFFMDVERHHALSPLKVEEKIAHYRQALEHGEHCHQSIDHKYQVFIKMVALKEILPPAKSTATTFYHHSSDPWFKQRYRAPTADEKAKFVKTNHIPVYNTVERFKYMPSKPQDFGDGGAFSEIHYAQYPLDMGRKKDSNSGLKTLPVSVDDKGN
ncbi:SNW/SKI-interacting protein A-like protein [Tanacetum coccineum]